MFEWNQGYETGISFIDDHHKRLFELAYKITYNQKNNKDVFNQLLDFIKFNFAIEEDYMSEVEYTDFKKHRDAHNIFIKRLCYLKTEEFDNEENYEKLYWEKVFHFIYSWLNDHMLSEDAKYSNMEDAI